MDASTPSKWIAHPPSPFTINTLVLLPNRCVVEQLKAHFSDLVVPAGEEQTQFEFIIDLSGSRLSSSSSKVRINKCKRSTTLGRLVLATILGKKLGKNFLWKRNRRFTVQTLLIMWCMTEPHLQLKVGEESGARSSRCDKMIKNSFVLSPFSWSVVCSALVNPLMTVWEVTFALSFLVYCCLSTFFFNFPNPSVFFLLSKLTWSSSGCGTCRPAGRRWEPVLLLVSEGRTHTHTDR